MAFIKCVCVCAPTVSGNSPAPSPLRGKVRQLVCFPLVWWSFRGPWCATITEKYRGVRISQWTGLHSAGGPTGPLEKYFFQWGSGGGSYGLCVSDGPPPLPSACLFRFWLRLHTNRLCILFSLFFFLDEVSFWPPPQTPRCRPGPFSIFAPVCTNFSFKRNDSFDSRRSAGSLVAPSVLSAMCLRWGRIIFGQVFPRIHPSQGPQCTVSLQLHEVKKGAACAGWGGHVKPESRTLQSIQCVIPDNKKLFSTNFPLLSKPSPFFFFFLCQTTAEATSGGQM